MDRWYKLFAPRQLLAMLTYLESLGELAPEMERDLGKERAAAVRTYLAVVLDKCANYGTASSLRGTLPMNPSQRIRSGMTSHEMVICRDEHGSEGQGCVPMGTGANSEGL